MPGMIQPVAHAKRWAIPSSVQTQTLAQRNLNRRSLTIYNDSSAVLYIGWGDGTSTSDFSAKVPAGSLYELPEPVYSGLISGVWASTNGAAYVTEGA